jgi:hypothetical protein
MSSTVARYASTVSPSFSNIMHEKINVIDMIFFSLLIFDIFMILGLLKGLLGHLQCLM